MYAYTVFHINANIHIHASDNKVAYIVMTMNTFVTCNMSSAWTSHFQSVTLRTVSVQQQSLTVTSAFLSSLRKYCLRNWQFHLKELIQT